MHFQAKQRAKLSSSDEQEDEDPEPAKKLRRKPGTKSQNEYQEQS